MPCSRIRSPLRCGVGVSPLSAHTAWIAELAPAKELAGQHRGATLADAAQGEQWAGDTIRPELLAPENAQRRDPSLQSSQLLPFTP